MILSKCKKLLATGVSKCDNNRTTKLTSAKPSRHTLAIFTPTHSTGVNISSLLSTDNVLTVYGGLIEPNKIPFLGNKFSRMLAVVETRQPFLWLAKLTKLTGASIMTAFLTGILAKLSHFTPAESLVLGFIVGLPMACLVIGFLSVMGV
ncbi:hypothetical protein AAX05_06125 [Moraxella bovoculi]|uniref:Uncharacterized protein n=1 Tax=Moraxella bovoculi TaxID=386891 RepID=A0AAC8PVK1_9GAMM|nr:hypothetical protein AAX06_04825 [Moraxella bovoculi]AKG09804.1 hypothetical protein AAX05_06125 [Moraxella bovoculi]AKG11722.1 hypothetical protein AAX07_06680 [Moraxella bovoculi]AKG13689.1 hypothetical protein AAX11_06210 [Moraxella bovoculi]